MILSLMPYPKIRFFNAAGTAPLAGGLVYTYEPGTSTPKATYTDSTGGTANTNPVVLDANGEASIWMNGFYKVILKDSLGSQQWSGDNVSSMPNTTTALSEWIVNGLVPTYIATTQFSVQGDETARFHQYRRIKCTVSAGTVYGVITASSLASGVTTVTVSLDSGALDSGISIVSESILANTNPSVPEGLRRVLTGTAAGHAPNLAQIQAGSLVYAADTGAADAYVVTLAPAVTAYTTGMEWGTRIAHANATTTPTINVNGLGAKTIVRPDGTALVADDLPLNWNATFHYDGTNAVLLNPYTLRVHTHANASTGGQITVTGVTAVLGTWDATKAVDTVYQAATDLFVTCFSTGGVTTNSSLDALTDVSNPPTTRRDYEINLNATYNSSLSVKMVVKKGDYWKVVKTGTMNAPTINIIPLGS